MQVRPDTLPRALVQNESSISPLLLCSGPAHGWTLLSPEAVREQEARDAASAPPPAAGKAGAKPAAGKAAKPAAKAKAAAPAKGAKPGAAATAADAGPTTVRWQAGRPLLVVVSAVDAVGELDADLDTVVLVEAPAEVQGAGLVSVEGGVAKVPLLCNKSGDMKVVMFDGGFTTMAPAPPLTLAFFGGPAVAVAFVLAEKDVADVEKGILVEKEVSVHVRLVDMHDNVSPEFEEATVEVRLSHGASGGGPIVLAQGEASITVRSEVAGRVEISAAEVKGLPVARNIDTSRVLEVPYGASEASALSLRLAPGTKAVAGELTRLQVYSGDAHGNYAKKAVAGDVAVVAAAPATVERGGAATVVEGEGEVWVRVEEDTARFWLGPGSLPGGLTARHTEENPFVLTLESGGVAQLGLYAASDTPTRVGEAMTVLVRTEDSFGNLCPSSWAGRVMVRCRGAARGAGEVMVMQGEGRLVLQSDVAETVQLSLHDGHDCGALPPMRDVQPTSYLLPPTSHLPPPTSHLPRPTPRLLQACGCRGHTRSCVHTSAPCLPCAPCST